MVFNQDLLFFADHLSFPLGIRIIRGKWTTDFFFFLSLWRFFFFPPISPPPPFCRGGECARTREAPSPPCSARHQETPPDRRSPDTCARQPGSGPRRRRWRRWTRSCPRGAPRPVTPLPPLPPAAAPGWYLPPAARALSELGRKGRLRGAGGAPPKSVWNYLRPRRMDGRHVPGTRGQRSSSPGSERGAPPAECAVWRRWWWWW